MNPRGRLRLRQGTRNETLHSIQCCTRSKISTQFGEKHTANASFSMIFSRTCGLSGIDLLQKCSAKKMGTGRTEFGPIGRSPGPGFGPPKRLYSCK